MTLESGPDSKRATAERTALGEEIEQLEAEVVSLSQRVETRSRGIRDSACSTSSLRTVRVADVIGDGLILADHRAGDFCFWGYRRRYRYVGDGPIEDIRYINGREIPFADAPWLARTSSSVDTGRTPRPHRLPVGSQEIACQPACPTMGNAMFRHANSL
jgi:hypothetical protein